MQKAIGDLINNEYKFFIPFYQRGYRWEKEQIVALLEDLWEFHKKLKRKEKGYRYYSLQPLVVKYDEEKQHYRVVDGQQRLTTIYLILSAMEDILNDEIEKFGLEYQREGSKEFLKNIKLKTEKNSKENLDFFYMYNAYIIIKKWIIEKFTLNERISKSNLKKFRDFIICESDFDEEEKKDLNENIRFIWYEIDKNESEFDVFIRLNIGKIPLTNAELIKSFIIQKTIKTYRNELANEWDNIEYALEDNEFFGFLTTKNYKTRIELIFQILINLDKYKNYELYEKFVEHYESKNTKDIWKKIKNIFYTLKFWYEDRELYHLIGYLVSIGKNIVEVFEIYNKSKNKKDFKIKLKNKILKTLTSDLNKFLEEIDELSYGDKKLLKVLLLFNIVSLINSSKDSYVKFSFYRFNDEKWSLEHITPQTDKKLDLAAIKKELEEIKNNLNNPILNQLLAKEKLNKDDIKELEQIFSDEKINSDKDNIRNLTLLSFKDNSSLKNNFFPVKRKMIIKMDKEGRFIPIATKNLFLKYYSYFDKNPEKWSFEDGENYVKVIKESFKKFFEGIENE